MSAEQNQINYGTFYLADSLTAAKRLQRYKSLSIYKPVCIDITTVMECVGCDIEGFPFSFITRRRRSADA